MTIHDKARLIFFDLDKTLTWDDTDELWAHWRAGKSFQGTFEGLWLLYLSRQYKKGKLSGKGYLDFHKFRLKNYSLKEYTDLCNKFFLLYGKESFIIPMTDFFKEYQKHNKPCIIITAQNYYIAKPFADYLKADHLCANEIEFIDETWGLPVKPYCFEDGKIHYAERYASSQDISLKECAFYSDSIHDLPLLSKVGYPVIVNPDKRLEKEAETRGWKILKFERTI